MMSPQAEASFIAETSGLARAVTANAFALENIA
jgi:hypothetical protein